MRISAKAENYFNKLGKPTKDSIRAGLTAPVAYRHPLEHPDAKPLLGPEAGRWKGSKAGEEALRKAPPIVRGYGRGLYG